MMFTSKMMVKLWMGLLEMHFGSTLLVIFYIVVVAM